MLLVLVLGVCLLACMGACFCCFCFVWWFATVVWFGLFACEFVVWVLGGFRGFRCELLWCYACSLQVYGLVLDVLVSWVWVCLLLVWVAIWLVLISCGLL